MMEYEDYLYYQGYAKGTIDSYQRSREKFDLWCKTTGYDPMNMDYKSFLGYIRELQLPKGGKVLSKSSVKHTVGGLKIYFDYLVGENYRPTNPAANIHIRGVKRTLNHNLLEFEELEDLYYSYRTEGISFSGCPSVAVRNKLITGFMVYQGLNATSLKALKVGHVDMNKGKVYIPSTRKTNSRRLELRPQQIVSLGSFLEVHRSVLQEKIGCCNDDLFPLSGERFYILHEVFKELKKQNHAVKDVKQIRASVINYWLQHHNIREVQYMAGHRYISATERYVQDDLEDLQEMIERLHPIG